MLNIERALLYRPSRTGVESAWYGHVPFGYWLAGELAPRVLVELGTHAGVSYSAFCDAVMDRDLATRCFAVDTWQGDEHAGFYDESVYEDLQRFHDRRYGAFSRMIRATFNDARSYIPDGSVDLLHIDGAHTYEAVRTDFETWLPKLSERGVILFHDTNVRERNFGVWRLWQELRGRYVGFEFLHAHGLGVLAVGPEVPAPVWTFAQLDADTLGQMRRCFASIGERWETEAQLAASRQVARALDRDLRIVREGLDAEIHARVADAERAIRASADARTRAAEQEAARARAEIEAVRDGRRAGIAQARAAARQEIALLRGALRHATRLRAAHERRIAGLLRTVGRLHREMAALHETLPAPLRREIDQLRREYAELDRLYGAMCRSTFWRATAPLRLVAGRLPRGLRPGGRVARGNAAIGDALGQGRAAIAGAAVGRDPADADPVDADAVDADAVDADAVDADAEEIAMLQAHGPVEAAGQDSVLRIAYISGEPATPGHLYRVQRQSRAAAAAGHLYRLLRPAQAAIETGHSVVVIDIAEVDDRLDEIAAADIVVIWRATWSPVAARVTEIVRAAGSKLVFDIDDLMFDPSLARIEVIDGIRSQGFDETSIAAHFTATNHLMMHADACTCTTEELAFQLRRFQRPAYVLPNGFDAPALRLSRNLVRRRRAAASDGLVRIGYAGGSRTHQRDFAVAAPAIARVLAERPDCRLVLFQSSTYDLKLLDTDEFASLHERSAQIEWREMVPVEDLPREVARFDINLAPLEARNPFCEAKSELKFFEAALVEVCTIATPTGPLRRAIRDGETGFLATTTEDYYAALIRLVDDAALRARVAHAAYLDVLWPFGPERRAEATLSFFQQIAGGRAASRAFELEAHRAAAPRPPRIARAAIDTVFERDSLGDAEVTVVVPLYNYANYVEEALDSVAAQTLATIDLVIVEDRSTDDSLAIARAWAEANAERFNRIVLLQNRANAGLGIVRNTGIDAAETPYVMLLDADNRLLPDCIARCLAAIVDAGAAFAYPSLRHFGDSRLEVTDLAFQPMRLAGGNYIDAMALVSKTAWAAVGGFAVMDPNGWEDFDFWCSCADRGLGGVHVPEILAEYRVHAASMLRTATDIRHRKLRLIADIQARHDWLHIPPPEEPPPEEPRTEPPGAAPEKPEERPAAAD
jgi:glycosyltransferase involved in cell wall biosynthesis